MATIPGVSDGELVRTSWGDAVADELNNEAVKRDGTVQMTGYLLLPSGTSPTLGHHAAHKFYVDQQVAVAFNHADVRVAKAGDTMTGLLTINPAGSNCLRLVGNTSTMDFYSEASTRFGYISATVAGLSIGAVDSSSGVIAFNTDASVERMRLQGATLLIGKTAADTQTSGVEIPAGGNTDEGMIASTTTAAGIHNLFAKHIGAANANGQNFATFMRSTTEVGSISQGSGNNCVFNAGSGGTHVSTSDYRYKDDLGPIDDPVGKLMALQPKHLAWNDVSGTVGEFDGFLAHEVTPVAPFAVVGDKDAVKAPDDPNDPGGIDPQGLDEKKLVPLLTAALQEAHNLIADLTARLETLEAAA